MVERKAPEGGFSEEESWRLFRQLVEALVHLQQNGILHRDIKLSNIFIDAKGDAKASDLEFLYNHPDIFTLDFIARRLWPGSKRSGA
jgi:serine/threonine protein kinase